MNDQAQGIREAIQHIAHAVKPGGTLLVAEVTEVTETDCSVQLGETKITKVKLFSQEADPGNILLKPKVGSMALIADLSFGDLRDLVLIWADKISSFKFEENGLVIEFDSESKKIDIKNDQVGLKDLFQSVSDIIKQITVSTPSGPSGTPLPPT